MHSCNTLVTILLQLTGTTFFFLRMWTCFEYTLMHVTELMKDRHIDQILMCSIYVMGKVNFVCVAGRVLVM